MILETNKVQYERCVVLGYDALRMYDGFNVVRTTLVQGYNKPTISFFWTDDYPECILVAMHPKYNTAHWADGAVIGRGASAYDALLMARNDQYTIELECEDVINDLLIQLTR